MSEKLKMAAAAIFTFIWRLRFARILWKTGYAGPKLAWKIADSSDDYREWGMTPREAVEEELSYWRD